MFNHSTNVFIFRILFCILFVGAFNKLVFVFFFLFFTLAHEDSLQIIFILCFFFVKRYRAPARLYRKLIFKFIKSVFMCTYLLFFVFFLFNNTYFFLITRFHLFSAALNGSHTLRIKERIKIKIGVSEMG